MRLYAASFLLTAAVWTAAVTVTAPSYAQAPAAKPAPAAPAKADDTDKTYPAQATVAAKTPFATVPASDKAVAGALDAAALAEALKMVGKPGAFQGTVSAVYSPDDHDVTILDFAPHYKEAVTAPVQPDDYAKLPDLSALKGKRVLVSGIWSKNAHGAAQITLTAPGQIKIIQ